MCGLVGVLRLADSASPVDLELLLRMRDTMAHRGPDGTGAWTADDGSIGLAFRRLAIIDLSAQANQLCAAKTARCALSTTARYTTTPNCAASFKS